MKPIIIGIDIGNGKEDYTAETVIKNGQIMYIGLFRKNKNYGESPLIKCLPDLVKMKKMEDFNRKRS